jgi:hypothetical protein
LLLLTAALLLGSAAAEPVLLLDDHWMRLQVTDYELSPGQVTLRLHGENTEVWNRDILLFAPMMNDQPASFRHGWPSEAISIAPLSETDAEVAVFADDPALWPESVSFRVIEAGEITGEVRLSFQDGKAEVQPAGFIWQETEPPLITKEVIAPEGRTPFLLQDALTPEEMSKLDYGQLVVCLRREADGQEQLIPFATIMAEAAPDGTISATYSGNAVVCTAIPDFPLLTTEDHRFGQACHVRDLALSGPFIFYASLQLTLSDVYGPVQVNQFELDSFDTGPMHENLPLALFDTLRLSRPVYQAQGASFAQVDAISHSLSLAEPLSFSIVPAGSLGEVVAYFEYFFLDSTDVIHPLFFLDIP